MALSMADGRDFVVILENANTALRNLGQSVALLQNLATVPQILRDIKDDLEHNGKVFKDMIQDVSSLGTEYQVLERETRSHVRTVKEAATRNLQIFDQMFEDALDGKDISGYVDITHQGAKRSLESIQELKQRYDDVIGKVHKCLTEAGHEQKQNEFKASAAQKIGTIGGLTVGGGVGALQVGSKCLSVFGPMGAAAGTVLGLAGGLAIGALAGGTPGKLVSQLYEGYAEKFQNLEVALNRIDLILADNTETLTEITRLLADLKHICTNVQNVQENPFLVSFQLNSFKTTSTELKGYCDMFLEQTDVRALQGVKALVYDKDVQEETVEKTTALTSNATEGDNAVDENIQNAAKESMFVSDIDDSNQQEMLEGTVDKAIIPAQTLPQRFLFKLFTRIPKIKEVAEKNAEMVEKSAEVSIEATENLDENYVCDTEGKVNKGNALLKDDAKSDINQRSGDRTEGIMECNNTSDNISENVETANDICKDVEEVGIKVNEAEKCDLKMDEETVDGCDKETDIAKKIGDEVVGETANGGDKTTESWLGWLRGTVLKKPMA